MTRAWVAMAAVAASMGAVGQSSTARINQVGSYGPWLSEKVLGDGPARLSFRTGRWGTLDEWRGGAGGGAWGGSAARRPGGGAGEGLGADRADRPGGDARGPGGVDARLRRPAHRAALVAAPGRPSDGG